MMPHITLDRKSTRIYNKYTRHEVDNVNRKSTHLNSNKIYAQRGKRLTMQ